MEPDFIDIGEDTLIEEGATLFAVRLFGDHPHKGEIIIGNGVYINYSVNITATDRVKIGDLTTLAYNVSLLNYSHSYEDPNIHINSSNLESKGELLIGKNCWIGANVVIVGGIRIGDHCVIGANSLVTKDIPSYCVAVGNPAVIVKRYNPDKGTWEKVN